MTLATAIPETSPRMTINNVPMFHGTVSTGTQRTRDLLPVLCAEYMVYSDSTPPVLVEAEAWLQGESTYYAQYNLADFELCGAELVGEMIEALDALAPEGTYFGAHPGDPSDFGWWPSDET